jgi:hypothetical protein
MKALDKLTGQWRQEFMSDCLSSVIRILINQAGIDLHYGSSSLENYPGFTSACKLIRAALDEQLPSQLWFDVESGSWQEKEPAIDCAAAGDWYEGYYVVERYELQKIIVGKELIRYL